MRYVGPGSGDGLPVAVDGDVATVGLGGPGSAGVVGVVAGADRVLVGTAVAVGTSVAVGVVGAVSV
ncbi:hypothetical protein DKT68_22795, partial [Micromonospora acroterricola]